MKKILAKWMRALSIFIVLCIIIACVPLSAQASDNEMLNMAMTVYENMLRLYWRGGPETGHLMKEHQGMEITDEQRMIWAHAQMIFAFEALYAMDLPAVDLFHQLARKAD